LPLTLPSRDPVELKLLAAETSLPEWQNRIVS
jgi:hypothetical protein